MNDEKKQQSPAQNDRRHKEYSLAEFSRETGIRIELLRRFINRQTRQVTNDTWNKILPAFKLLSEQDTQASRRIGPPYRRHAELVEMFSDQKVLLDVINVFPSHKRAQIVAEWCRKSNAAPTAYTSLTAEENKLMGAFLAMDPESREKELLELVKQGREAVREQR
jgi:hypothetical protein